MSAMHTAAMVFVFLVAPPVGPTLGQVDHWIADLGSDDSDTWRQASERLWKAGRIAEPALRAATKHRDPDVVLRARLVLSRFEWGIFPDTPPAVVKLIEQYRDGDQPQRQSVVADLLKQGKLGSLALQRVLAREQDAMMRQFAADYLKRQYRPLVRDLLAGGDRSAAATLLETTAATDSDDAVRDLAALWVLTGQAATKARELERLAAGGDKRAAVRCAYLHRSNGDLAAARRLAELAGDEDLLGGILDEQGDFKALAKKVPKKIQDAPGSLATVLHHAGDQAGFEAALKRIAVTDHATRAQVLFFNGAPDRAIEEERKAGYLSAVCEILALQGKRREALALSADKSKQQDQSTYLMLEHAVLYHYLGEKEKASKLFERAIGNIEQPGQNVEAMLAAVLRAGTRMNRRKKALDEVALLLDRVKQTTAPHSLLAVLSERDSSEMALWWDYLQRQSLAPSAIFARLRRWFDEGKADKDFDALIDEVERSKALPVDQQERWPAVLARTCIVVGKLKLAEDILRNTARTMKSAEAHRRLGDFYLERKRWNTAAVAYGWALRRDRTDVLALYLRGLALSKAGQVKQGRALLDRAQLLPLADEEVRYNLAKELVRRGFTDEANAVRLVLMRTASFGSIYATNAASSLAVVAERQQRYQDAARYHRRSYLNLILKGGMFTDSTSEVQVPGWVHLNRSRALVAAGKLDAAIEENKRLLEYLPEEDGAVIDLVRALDRAKRKADADKQFDIMFNRLQKACLDFPRAAGCHNRLAWFLVRCGRQLDRAQRHARTATMLMPQTAGFLDTLAEIHFQRGDSAEAAALLKRAVKLAPGRAYYLAQLRRIEAGDRNAEVPQQ